MLPRRTRRPTTRCNFDASVHGGVGISRGCRYFRQPLFLPIGFHRFSAESPMRLPLLIALTALSLGGCGKGNQAENMTNADQGLAAENIVSNDVTAIDAVTG